MTKRKPWVLDTGTKGTGAEMVPLEKVLKKPGPGKEPVVASAKRPPRTAAAPEPRKPRRFKVVDVMSGQVLAQDVDARAAVETLEQVRSVVDVRVYVWQPRTKRWRLLNLGEQKAMWERRTSNPE
jgi:hypothetical protein